MTTNDKDKEPKKSTLSLGGGAKTLSLKTGPAAAAPAGSGMAGRVQQSFSGGRTKTVAVELRRKRGIEEGTAGSAQADTPEAASLSAREREARTRALAEAAKRATEPKKPVSLPKTEDVKTAQEPPKSPRQREMEEMERIRAAEMAQIQTIEVARKTDDEKRQESANKIAQSTLRVRPAGEDESSPNYRDRLNRLADRKTDAPVRKIEPATGGGGDWKRAARMALTGGDDNRGEGRSMASLRRARAKSRDKSNLQEQVKQIREVILPEIITVQELAIRMTERSGNLVKSLMKMGVMATATQSIDADTAELLILEFGHKVKRVTENDVEIGITGPDDTTENLITRPPVVTIMGHVDHGKTSLLDALRQTNVVAGEAGGITQHIGAYQITAPSGRKITFLDTPGHAAFSAMRARGANVTDIVVLVVAANDGIMPQTIEAINHAKAANVPIIVAINKVDLPDANPEKVKTDLLQHEIILESMGGDVLSVEVSAKKKIGLDKLEEAILLQADVLDLKANPNRSAAGTVIESRVEIGRGSVASVLINKGTLKVGDIFVTGAEWGRVRALLSDVGAPIKTAIPGQPVGVLGLNGTPNAGDDFAVVDTESRARDITEFRQRKKREAASVTLAKNAGGTMEQRFAQIKEGGKTVISVVIKADVHGSAEAIAGSLQKISTDNPDIQIQVLHAGVGAITETDVSLASATNAFVIGFNVRANAQARDLSSKQGIDIRYYSIIYNVIDDVKVFATGLLAPTVREEFIGNAAIRQVFNITKVGKIAGCIVTEGFVKRGAKVRLLRDNVVIHEGKLKTLKRFKDEVKEVKEGTECGMAFEAYDDMREGDVIECFDLVEEKRSVA